MDRTKEEVQTLKTQTAIQESTVKGLEKKLETLGLEMRAQEKQYADLDKKLAIIESK